MNWIQLIDKHPDGFGFIVFAAIVGLTISVVSLALALSEFGGRRK